MKIIIRGVIDWATLAIEHEDSYEYAGPVAQCKDPGSAPAPVDPYVQAQAQYGLSTGTALYNAGLNRTNQTNPIGSSYWSTNAGGGGSGPAPTSQPLVSPNGTVNPQIGGAAATSPPGTTNNFGVSNQAGMYPGGSGAGATTNYGGTGGVYGLGGGLSGTGLHSLIEPPTYTYNTQLAPQFQDMLQKPIDTSGIAGMPGGPSTTQDLQSTQDALYKSQEQYLQPEQKLQTEQLQSQLANEGATPGSAAYGNEMDRLAREQEFANSNARTSAITGGGAEQSRLFGLGSQSLGNQITARNAPISEFNALSGAPGATATALTPDISGAFGQQYSGQLAGYNANVASDNATTSTVGSLAAMLAIYF